LGFSAIRHFASADDFEGLLASGDELDAFVVFESNFQLLEVDHNAMVVDPEPIVDAIDQFLGGGLEVVAMSSAVDPSLYRTRAN
jgi:hypothetical protein